jgi:branched-chain amino acid transport system ATP-binding protein
MENHSPHEIARYKIAYAPQDAALFPDLTTEENLRVALPKSGPEFEVAFRAATAHFPILAERRKQRAGTLSGGEQKMLVIARALLVSPDLILLDEITEGLQPLIIDRVRAAIQEENARTHATIFLVEQHISFALSVAEDYLVMRQGRLVARGRTRDPNAQTNIEAALAL